MDPMGYIVVSPLRNAVTALPGVAMAAVVAVPHPKWDERPVVVAPRKRITEQPRP